MPAILVTPPKVEPITIAQARLQCKEDLVGTDIDDKIMLCMAAARQMCENDMRRAIISQQWKVSLDQFSAPSLNISSSTWYGPQWGTTPGPMQSVLPDGTTGYEVFLPFPPLISVDSISYIDPNGVTQTMNVTTDILVDSTTEPARLFPAYNTTWPSTLRQGNAATITYTCGYGSTPDKVPPAIQQWILVMGAAMYDLPQAEMAVYRETLIAPKFVDRLLDPFRIRRY